MKDNQTTAAAITSQFETPNQNVIDPVFTECLHQLRDIYSKISQYYENNNQLAGHDEYYLSFEDNMSNVASTISEMARVNYVESQYFSRIVVIENINHFKK